MNRHDTDRLSLTVGVVFAALVGGWLLVRWVGIHPAGLGWLGAATLLAFGALGITMTLRPWRGHQAVQETPDQIERT